VLTLQTSLPKCNEVSAESEMGMLTKFEPYLHKVHVRNEILDFLDNLGLGCRIELLKGNIKYRLLFRLSLLLGISATEWRGC
jgi:hypothetical protein